MSIHTQIQKQFTQFCKLYNLRNSGEKGVYPPAYDYIKLDFAPMYGGYRLDIIQTDGGEDHFDGQRRRTPKEMLSYLEGLISAKSEIAFRNIIKL